MTMNNSERMWKSKSVCGIRPTTHAPMLRIMSKTLPMRGWHTAIAATVTATAEGADNEKKKITRQEYVMKRNDILSTNSKFALQFHPHTHICMMDVAPEQIHHITWRGETCDYYNNDMQFCASWLDFITHSFCTLLQCNYVSLSSCFIEQRWSDIRFFVCVCVFLPVFPSLTDFIRNHCSLFELDILHFVGAGIVVCEWMNKIRKSPAKYASMSSKFIKINYQFLFIFKVPVHSHASHHTFAHTNDFVWCASERSVHFGVFLSMIFCR